MARKSQHCWTKSARVESKREEAKALTGNQTWQKTVYKEESHSLFQTYSLYNVENHLQTSRHALKVWRWNVCMNCEVRILKTCDFLTSAQAWRGKKIHICSRGLTISLSHTQTICSASSRQLQHNLFIHMTRFCCGNDCFCPLKYISHNSSESSLQLPSQSTLIKRVS